MLSIVRTLRGSINPCKLEYCSNILRMSSNQIEVAIEEQAAKLSKSQKRRLRNKEHDRRKKEKKKLQKASQTMTNDSDIVQKNHLTETSYYFENGLRKVYPYYFMYTTHTKGRWYGRTLQDVFSDEFFYKSEEEVIEKINDGKLLVNGKRVNLKYRLKAHDHLESIIHRHELAVTDDEIEIIHNSEDLLVINKPASIPIHPCGRYRHNSITHILAKEGGYRSLRACYRLDRLTSGVVMFGKTEGAAHKISSEIRSRQVEKEYICRVAGQFPSEVIECKQPIDCLSKKIGLWKVCKNGKSAHTTFERVSYNGSTSVVKCKPHTGRTHQIRVHLQFLGYPIANDPMYRGALWGPEEGKAGEFGRPEEEVIEDLKKLHNPDQFLDVENDSERAQVSSCDTNKPESILDPNSPLNPHSNQESLSTTTASVQSLKRNLSDSELLNKNAKHIKVSDKEKPVVDNNTVCDDVRACCDTEITTDSHSEGTEEKGGVNSMSSNTCLQNDVAKVEADNDKICTEISGFTFSNTPDTELEAIVTSNQSTGGASSDSKALPASKTDGKIITKIDIDALPVVQKGFSDSDLTVVKTRLPFDPSLMTHDPDCIDCKQRYKDPKPGELIIYLHAYSYKGPDWKYTTPLPQWADENWTEEQEQS